MKISLIFPALFLAAALPAAPVRVATWDLESGTNKPRQSSIQETARSLKNLRPDVILLQHVANWQACQQLADALRPEVYRVATCSGWRSSQQVAILSKTKAYIARSETWETDGRSTSVPGGFCFAAVRLDGRNVGIFSVEVGDGASATAARQLTRKIASFENWKANRLQVYVVAGNFNTASGDLRLEQLGFDNAFARPPLCMFTRDAGLVSSPVITQADPFEHEAVTCEMDFDAPKPKPAPVTAAAPVVPPPVIRAELPPARPAPAPAIVPASHLEALNWLAGILTCCFVFLFFLARKISRRAAGHSHSPALLDWKANSSATIANLHTGQITVTSHPEGRPQIPDEIRAGVINNLSQWMKQKVMRRLVSDRAQLLATQEAAKLKVLAVDERLTKVEHQVQQRNQDYEQRIDALLKALVNAEEQNRELIRAQILLLKSEMEKSRLRQQTDERQEH